MFLVAVQIMLSNVRAERESEWSAHLMSSSKMLPYFFVTNRTNYFRWMPVYILDMLELPAEIKSAFEKGGFSIRTFDNIICTATRNISQYLNVSDASHPHFLNLPISGCTWSSSNSSTLVSSTDVSIV
jgi:hypothetical protein